MAVKRDVLRVRMLVFACLLRTSKSGRARGVEWAEAVDTGAFYSDAQQKPSGSGQCEKNCAYKTLYLLLLSADMISHFVIISVYLDLQRINDSMMICAEPDDFTVGEFITVGLADFFRFY